MDRLKSRKLWVAIGAALVVVGGAVQGAIPADQAISDVVKIAFGYLATEGAIDALGALRK